MLRPELRRFRCDTIMSGMKSIPPTRILLGIAGVLVAAVLWFTTARPVVVLPRIRLAPGYTLQNAAGSSVTSEDQRGKLTLYSFAYTRCTQDCAAIYTSLEEIDRLLAQRGPLNPPLRFITLTVDPGYDTPQQLGQFRPAFQPAAVEWLWLTGSEKWIKTIVGGNFNVLYQPQEDGSVFFAPQYVLVDGNGIVRAVYEGAELKPAAFVDQLDLLYTEIEQSSGAARLAYEAAHFFACYPH